MKLENTTEHPIAITLGVKKGPDGNAIAGSGHTIVIPRGHNGDESNINGFARTVGSDGQPTGTPFEFDDAELTEAKLDPVVKSWFDSGDLIVAAGAPAPEPAHKAAMPRVTVEDDPPSGKHRR